MLRGLGLGLLLVAGAASLSWAQSSSRYDGQYVGALTLKGIISGDCTPPPPGSEYPLSISGGVVRFKYVARFDTTLVGTIDDKGNFKASARTKTGMINMVGHFVAYGRLTANIQSPSCMYAFDASN
jgi:hypothetical protein